MRQRALSAAVILFIAGSLVACEETVSPIVESDRQFTLYGTLDMNRDTQVVRVIPIRPTLIPEENALFDVTFASTDIGTGDRVEWKDSTVYFEDDVPGHLFYSPLRIRPGHTYRVEVQPPGSELVTSAETTVPAEAFPVVEEEVVTRLHTTRVFVRQKIRWQGVSEKPFAVEIWYRFFKLSDFGFMDVKLPYEPLHGPAPGSDDEWMIDMDLVRDRDSLENMIDLTRAIRLAGIGATVTILDDAFTPPGGVFDPEVLAQPGTFSNVTNGFGFVGSVGRFSAEWLIADTTARTLRYTPMGGTAYRDGWLRDAMKRE